MGHTNYWKVHNADCQAEYDLAKIEMKSFMHYCLVKHKYILNVHKYTDPITEEQINEIHFNGIEDEACEDFCLPEKVEDVVNDSFPFCKTNRGDYDAVVVGCLFILKKHLGTGTTISSDGYNHKSIRPDCDNYCDDEIKTAYALFKEFQAIHPTGFLSGGILPLFKPGKVK